MLSVFLSILILILLSIVVISGIGLTVLMVAINDTYWDYIEELF